MGNVSLNILGKESTEFSNQQELRTQELDKLSKENVAINKQLAADNERYERYKQNLISAANNEKSIDSQLSSAATWMSVHIWLFVALAVVVLVILIIPAGVVPNNYDALALYIVCGIALLYSGVRGIVRAARML
jgi:lipopolysaccharide export LptBFGC system permease protein LptF